MNHNTTMEAIDEVRLNFNEDNLFILNILLGFIMFGVALGIKKTHFTDLVKDPKSPIIGVISQFILLPFITFLLVMILRPAPSLALGMMLVAACPGGNISNFISSFSRSNAALSVGLTAIATLGAVIMTPLNFSFYGSLYPDAASILQDIQIDFLKMLKTVFILLIVPLILGMLFAQRFPKTTAKMQPPVSVLSFSIFTFFVLIAFFKNYALFLNWIHAVVFLVLIHNALGLMLGYFLPKVFKRPEKDCRAISIETGIQNSGLALVLIFNFFDGLGGMTIVAAWWGIWHMISGLTLAIFWKKRDGNHEVY